MTGLLKRLSGKYLFTELKNKAAHAIIITIIQSFFHSFIPSGIRSSTHPCFRALVCLLFTYLFGSFVYFFTYLMPFFSDSASPGAVPVEGGTSEEAER